MKKKLNAEELNNVSGGESVGKEEYITCPHCNQKIKAEDAFVEKKKPGCVTYYYFKCPLCHDTWQSEEWFS